MMRLERIYEDETEREGGWVAWWDVGLGGSTRGGSLGLGMGMDLPRGDDFAV
jgi:hypothetical protein